AARGPVPARARSSPAHAGSRPAAGRGAPRPRRRARGGGPRPRANDRLSRLALRGLAVAPAGLGGLAGALLPRLRAPRRQGLAASSRRSGPLVAAPLRAAALRASGLLAAAAFRSVSLRFRRASSASVTVRSSPGRSLASARRCFARRTGRRRHPGRDLPLLIV